MTGVQTCALPIWGNGVLLEESIKHGDVDYIRFTILDLRLSIEVLMALLTDLHQRLLSVLA